LRRCGVWLTVNAVNAVIGVIAMIPRFLSAGINEDGRLEVFAIDGVGEAYHKWEVFPDLHFTDWVSLGGTDLRACAVGNDALGRLQLVVLGGDGALYIKGQSIANGNWTDWEGLGGTQLSPPVLGKLQDGSLQVLVVGGDGLVYNKSKVAPNGVWSDWRQLGANLALTGLTAGNNADGRLELFAVDRNGVAYHKWEADGGWSDWSSLGGASISQLAVGQNLDRRLELFAIGGDHAAYHMWQIVPNGNWSGFDGGLRSPSSRTLSQLAAVNSHVPDLGLLKLYAIDDIGGVQRIQQTQVNNGWQQQWTRFLPSGFRQLAVASQLEGKMGGRMGLFALNGDGTIFWSTGGSWKQLQ
jgi:hypothetical protein